MHESTKTRKRKFNFALSFFSWFRDCF